MCATDVACRISSPIGARPPPAAWAACVHPVRSPWVLGWLGDSRCACGWPACSPRSDGFRLQSSGIWSCVLLTTGEAHWSTFGASGKRRHCPPKTLYTLCFRGIRACPMGRFTRRSSAPQPNRNTLPTGRIGPAASLPWGDGVLVVTDSTVGAAQHQICRSRTPRTTRKDREGDTVTAAGSDGGRDLAG